MGALATGIKEIFATAKTTGTNVMMCGNDGTPDGHITMSNLASVLCGLMSSLNMAHAGDANNEKGANKTISFLEVSDNYANYPEDVPRGFLIVCRINESYIYQIYLKGRTGNLYTRIYITSGWSEWQQVYDTSLLTNRTLLTPLASALGALTLMNKSSTSIPSGVPANYGHYYQCKNSYYQLNVVMGMSSGNCTGIWVAGAVADVAYENLVWHKLSWT